MPNPPDRWDRRIVVFDNWTEFGEGHYIEPTTGTGLHVCQRHQAGLLYGLGAADP